jgi:2-hydroxycyclohexanecarboxyl-CoA dehydrogenase
MKITPDLTVLVTGAGSGIGAGIAGAFAARGCRVVVTDLDPEAAAAVAAGLGDAAEGRGLDVRDRDAWARLVAESESWGGVDILVNNAGVGFLTPATEATFAQWDWVLGINLTGTYNGIRSIVPGMLVRERPAHIVTTASIGGMIAARGAVYSAAKYGVVGLVEALRAELLGTRVGTTLLLPGMVRTNILNGPPPPGEAADPRAGGDDASAFAHALSPEHVGRLVVAGVESDELYVFTHSEHREFLERRFEAIRSALPTDPAPEERAAGERAIFDLPVYHTGAADA